MRKKKILCVIGTRPEAVKMAPVVMALKKMDWAEVKVVVTAQHRGMLDNVLDVFHIRPDIDLNVMRPNQQLAELTAKLLVELDTVLKVEQPDAVLAQGDTTTVMVTALACFYQRIKFGHVEAGLRTGDVMNPFPEEMNRLIVGRMAEWHFAPTQSSAENLRREGLPPDSIEVTGNTVIDALLHQVAQTTTDTMDFDRSRRLILVTAHRRENFGQPFREICRAIRHLADTRSDIEILYPVHPNPNVLEVARAVLAGHPRIRLVEPLGYAEFIEAMRAAYFILSDSGGVQEEAPALGKPVLVLRHETERPEAVAEGVVRLVGPDFDRIVAESARLLDDPRHYAGMARGVSPYGDGQAAARIVARMARTLVTHI